jgi:predicted Zn finger-like uncharacterized protein
MILACPSCKTRYQVGDQAVNRPTGRQVRCANCGHGWHYMPVPPPIVEADLKPPSIPPRPVRLDRLASVPRPAITAASPARRRHSGGGVAFLSLLLVVGAVAAGAVFARDQVVAVWPPATRLYDELGLKTGDPAAVAAGAGLEIGKSVSNRTGGGLTVEVDIANPGGAARLVPKLRVAVQDASRNELAVKVVDPPKPRLSPGETEHFTVEFTPAGDQAVGADVTFAPG